MRVVGNKVYFCKGVLGNWAKTPMVWDGNTFFSSEQLFMYLKAFCFGDFDACEKILKCHTSAEAKNIGRTVGWFRQDEWDKIKFSMMYLALKTKMRYSDEFYLTLKEHSGKTFVECNPEDHIWAIGLAEDDDRILDEKNWQGENLLGQVLTLIAKNIDPND